MNSNDEASSFHKKPNNDIDKRTRFSFCSWVKKCGTHLRFIDVIPKYLMIYLLTVSYDMFSSRAIFFAEANGSLVIWSSIEILNCSSTWGLSPKLYFFHPIKYSWTWQSFISIHIFYFFYDIFGFGIFTMQILDDIPLLHLINVWKYILFIFSFNIRSHVYIHSNKNRVSEFYFFLIKNKIKKDIIKSLVNYRPPYSFARSISLWSHKKTWWILGYSSCFDDHFKEHQMNKKIY